MKEGYCLGFDPFRLDCMTDRLWRGQETVELRAKPLAVLRYLLEHPGQVVSGNELLKQVWAGIYVTKTALRVCLREIRLALGDEATAPQYIETVGRQGYRFIAPVVTTPLVTSSQFSVSSMDEAGAKIPQPATDNWSLTTRSQQLVPHFVGREAELAQLHLWLESAQAGHQQLVFVTGEPGIGKTTLVNTFLHRVQANGRPRIAHGQCVEQYGVGTPYLPLLGALGRLCQEAGAGHLVGAFEQHAPVWLSQLPTLLSQEQRKALGSHQEKVSHERMLRELTEVLAVLSAERPLVLVLEDLHWSDAATVETLAYLARRRDTARLFILGTYRPAHIVVGEHPLRRLQQELLAHELCRELRLELLSAEEVEEYVTQRLAGNALATDLSLIIHRRTEGNALFVANVVDFLLRQGLLQAERTQSLTPELVAAIQTQLPEGLQQLVLKEVEGLSPEEQQVLEAASVAGLHFSAAGVAAAAKSEEEYIEAVCDGLVRQQRLIEAGEAEEWPDGTLTAGYQFRHAVYQQVVCARVGRARQMRLHRLIGERLEAGYGARATEIASHLAVHFEQGQDRRAVYYRLQAAEHALRHNAYQEVYLHGAAGLALLETLPDTIERRQRELGLRQLLSTALIATRGFMGDEFEENLQRARQLCQEPEDDAALVAVLIGLGRVYQVRADRVAIADLEQQEYRLAERVQNAPLLAQLHTHLTALATFRGLHSQVAEHYQQVLGHYDPKATPFFLSSFGGDPFVMASSWSGMSLSLAGQAEQGWSQVTQARVTAEELNQPFALVNTLLIAVMVKLFYGEHDQARPLVQKMNTHAREYQFPLYRIGGDLLQGCITVQRGTLAEGIAEITTRLAEYRAAGVQLFVPFFLSFLAEGYRQQGKIAEALQAINEALRLTAANLDVYWEAELYRQKGELTLQQFQVPSFKFQVSGSKKPKVQSPKSKNPDTQYSAPSPQAAADAEAFLHKAVAIARAQEAKLLELRAVMSLSQLWHRQGKQEDARHRLAEIYDHFSEGFGTKDLQAARALLAEWSAAPRNAASPAKRSNPRLDESS